MARLRTIKPGFFTNDELGELPPLARLLYAGLWCIADREGRLEDRPKRVKAEVLPYDTCDVDNLLGQLTTGGFLTRYEAAGTRYIQIVNFAKHQQPHYKEVASVIPPPPGHQDSGVVSFGVSNEQRERIMRRDGYRCVECGSNERLSIDHIIPRSKGGSGDDDNLRALCLRHNTAKGNRNAKATSLLIEGEVGSTSVQRRNDDAPKESPDDPLSSVLGLLSSDSCLGSEGSAPDADASAPAALALVPVVPEAVAPLHDVLSGLPGYEANAAFFGKVDEKYGHLDLQEEAIKARAWLASHGKRRCTHGFILNWLKSAAEAERQGAIVPFRQRPANVSMADVAAAFVQATDKMGEGDSTDAA